MWQVLLKNTEIINRKRNAGEIRKQEGTGHLNMNTFLIYIVALKFKSAYTLCSMLIKKLIRWFSCKRSVDMVSGIRDQGMF